MMAKSAFFVLLALSYVTPLVSIAILFWKRRIWRPDVACWRWRVWNVGLALVSLAAVALPIFLLGISFLSDAAKQKWFIEAGSKGMFCGLVLSPVACILLGFGEGKQRWIGMVSASLSFVVLYVSMLAASF